MSISSRKKDKDRDKDTKGASGIKAQVRIIQLEKLEKR